MDLSKELISAIKIIKEAGKIVLDIYNSEDLGVEIKSDNSPVTKADKASDAYIKSELIRLFPSYGILTEESIDNKERLNKDFVWIVDPIDGTKDFVARDGEFTINIGLSYKHKAVLGVILIPVTGELFYAIHGNGAYYDNRKVVERIHVNNKTSELTVLQSHFFKYDREEELLKKHKDKIKEIKNVGSTVKMTLIARGLAEIIYRFTDQTKEWDTCAPQVLLEEAGGYMLDLTGKPLKYNRENVYNIGGFICLNNMENYWLGEN